MQQPFMDRIMSCRSLDRGQLCQTTIQLMIVEQGRPEPAPISTVLAALRASITCSDRQKLSQPHHREGLFHVPRSVHPHQLGSNETTMEFQ